MDTVQQAQKYEFKAEVKQLLDILVHSLYTSREIFLRELISNASDAMDKLRFESTKGTKVNDGQLPLEIYVSFDKDAGTLTISDSGIGMTKEEIVANIGTIAKSGTSEFLKQLAINKEDAGNLIGKFGIGFYSVFMISTSVIIRTKSFRENAVAVEWKSEGLGEYEITELDEDISRGTTITLNLREEGKEFAEKIRLETIIKKYSNFISYPIYLEKEKINTVSAIWREPKSSITKEQYTEFYKFLSHDYDEPMDTIHGSVEAPIQFNALLFIPKHADDMMFYNRDSFGLDLYVRKVMIQHKNKDLLPEYLGFVKGVVDSEDLPLNISRETLQESTVFSKISSGVTSQVLSYLKKKAKDDAEGYAEFWKTHSKIFKIGYGDYANNEKYSELLRFNTSANEDAKALSSLEEYVSRLKEGQKEIYYVAGSNNDSLQLDPHLEIFKKKGLEVLYLFDPIDEIMLSTLRKYKDYEYISVNQTDLSKVENFKDSVSGENKKEELNADDQLQFDGLVAKVKEILGDKVKEVVVSKRLTNSPSCLVNPDDPYSATFMRILRQSGRGEMPIGKKVFEINKDHNLVRNLLTIFKNDSNNAFINECVEQLYESALLLEGDLQDPHTLVNRINRILEKSSEFYSVKK